MRNFTKTKNLFILTFVLLLYTQSIYAVDFYSKDISGDVFNSIGSSEFIDIDADGDLDIHVANFSSNNNRLWLNDGLGNYTRKSIAGDNKKGYRSYVLDIDADGDLDIYSVSSSYTGNKLFLNDGTVGNPTFTDASIAGDYYASYRAAFGDIDGDGDIDIFGGGNGVQKLYLNDGTVGNPSFTSSALPYTNAIALSVYMVDIDADGDLDVFFGASWTSGRSAQSYIFVNDGLGNGGASLTLSPIGSATMGSLSSISDIDNDGDLDIYMGSTRSSSVIGGQNVLLLNDGVVGNASFSSSSLPVSVEAAGAYDPPILIDIDSDGDIDIYDINQSTENKLWLNDGTAGNPSFIDASITGDVVSSLRSTIADLNGDGHMDIYSADYLGGQNKIWLNDGTVGNPTFTNASIVGDMGFSRTNVSTGDVDGDGDIDIYVPNYSGGQNKLWINNDLPEIIITAPTKILNSAITDTTIIITDDKGVLVSDVLVDITSTVSTSAFNCMQTNVTTVDCTISITGQGDLVIKATDNDAQSSTVTESGYLIDLLPPSLPSVGLSLPGGTDPDNPTITFSSLDNVAVDYYTVTYNLDDGLGGSIGGTTTINPATGPLVLALDPDGTTSAPHYHEIIITAYDIVGNSTSTIIRFTPIVEFTVPTPINNTVINDATVTITSPSGNNLRNILLTSGSTGATGLTCPGDLGGGVYASPVTCSVNGVSSTGSIKVNATDDLTLAVGQNSQSFVIETTLPVATITAPDHESNTVITTTTIIVTDDTAINAEDVLISAINTVGSFSVSNQLCTQINPSRVDCTVDIDANTGTGDVIVNITDVAGNISSSTETGYEIDSTAPDNPSIPNLQTASDSGVSTTDNLTNVNEPYIDVFCTEAGSTLTLYGPFPTVIENIYCTAIETVAISLGSAPVLADGVYDFTYTETDDFGNESGQSPILQVTIDTNIATTTINSPTNGSPIKGTADFGATVVITTPSGANCTTTADVSTGEYSCSLAPEPINGENVTATANDIYGNESMKIDIAGIDTESPAPPKIDALYGGETVITGTGEIGSTITLGLIICTNSPIVVIDDGFGNGVWSCDVTVGQEPLKGETVLAISTDLAGNTSNRSYVLPVPTSHGSEQIVKIRTCSLTGNRCESRYPVKKNNVIGGLPFVDTIFNEYKECVIGKGVIGKQSCAKVWALSSGYSLCDSNNMCENIETVSTKNISEEEISYTPVETKELDLIDIYGLISEGEEEFDEIYDSLTTEEWNLLNKNDKFFEEKHVLKKEGKTCGKYLYKYLKIGENNDVDEVRKLQMFLKDIEGHNDLRNTGYFGQETHDNVVKFQEKYSKDVLSPWGITKGTGWVYQTTTKKINQLWCDRQ